MLLHDKTDFKRLEQLYCGCCGWVKCGFHYSYKRKVFSSYAISWILIATIPYQLLIWLVSMVQISCHQLLSRQSLIQLLLFLISAAITTAICTSIYHIWINTSQMVSLLSPRIINTISMLYFKYLISIFDFTRCMGNSTTYCYHACT